MIFIGKTGSGKTTLCQKLQDLKLQYKKTQMVEYYKDAIDTPGEYLENRAYYHAFMVSAADAKMIALLADPTVEENYLPPMFSTVFDKKVIGIVTKISLVVEQKKIELAKQSLQKAGANPVFLVDTWTGEGIQSLFDYLEEHCAEGEKSKV